MKHGINNAVLKAYRMTKKFIQDELPDKHQQSLLVTFRLGDLRELEAIDKATQDFHERRDAHKGNGDPQTILSGG